MGCWGRLDKQVDARRAVVDNDLGAVEVGEVATLAHINVDLFGFVRVAQRKHQPVLLEGSDGLWGKLSSEKKEQQIAR